MNERELSTLWTSLEPDADASRNIRQRVDQWMDAHDTSLAAEWMGLFSLEPLAAVGLTAASGLVLAVASPLAWILLG